MYTIKSNNKSLFNTNKADNTHHKQHRNNTSNNVTNDIRRIDDILNNLITAIEGYNTLEYTNISNNVSQLIDNLNIYVHRLNIIQSHHNSNSNSPIDGEGSNLFTDDDINNKLDEHEYKTNSVVKQPPPIPNRTNKHNSDSRSTDLLRSNTYSDSNNNTNSTTHTSSHNNHHQRSSTTAITSSQNNNAATVTPGITTSTTPGNYVDLTVNDNNRQYNDHTSSSSYQHYNDDDTHMISDDEAYARKLQAELEEQDRIDRQQHADYELQQLLKLTQSCNVCNNIICDNTLNEILECNHRICDNCIKLHLSKSLDNNNNNIVDNKCPVIIDQQQRNNKCCLSNIPDYISRRVLTDQQFDRLQQLALQLYFKHNGSIAITCPNTTCQHTFEAVEGDINDKSLDNDTGLNGIKLTKQTLQHRAKHRFRCSKCNTEFCSICNAIPYHTGYTCEQYKNYIQSNKCRFCETAITDDVKDKLKELITKKQSNNGNNNSSNSWFNRRKTQNNNNNNNSADNNNNSITIPTDICDNEECYDKYTQVCNKVLHCNHPCNGIVNEKICTGCLHNECTTVDNKSVDGQQFCTICYTDSLLSAPCIRLDCGHVYHYECILNKINKRWPGARITFGFLDCPECRAEISHVSLVNIIQPYKLLKQQIIERATARLQYEGCMKDDALVNKSSRYYKQPQQYALDRFAYYPCSKCQQPYFGGRRQCEQVNEQNESFNPNELVCGGCASGSDIASCQKHGKEFIEYKCKFCCNIATFYCWGTTHFCESCHTKQCQGQYVTRIPIDQLPKCNSAKSCPLGINHPPAGQEFALGCSICRPRYL